MSNRDQLSLPPDGRPESEQPAWRKDFPIDWKQDHYVARRDFTKFMVLVSLGLFVGQCWIGIQNWIRKRRGKPAALKIATQRDLRPGQTLMFNYPTPGDPCILICTDESELLAYGQK